MPSAAKSRPKPIKVKPLTSLSAWKQLKTHAKAMASVDLRSLLTEEVSQQLAPFRGWCNC